MGQPTQSAGTANEANAVSPSAGFIGWTPETDRTVYRVASSNKRGPAEKSDAVTRNKQFFR